MGSMDHMMHLTYGTYAQFFLSVGLCFFFLGGGGGGGEGGGGEGLTRGS